jgi:hypothetical protein
VKRSLSMAAVVLATALVLVATSTAGAAPGYDGPTGVGTPNGIGAF